MALLVGLQLPSGINSATSEGSIRTSRYWMDYTYFWRPHAFAVPQGQQGPILTGSIAASRKGCCNTTALVSEMSITTVTQPGEQALS